MAPFTFFNFVESQRKPLSFNGSLKLAGRTVIVTGSNVGLGFEAAQHFAHQGAGKLILAVRTPEKGEKAKSTIARRNPGVEIEVWPLDMTSFNSVKEFAKRAAGLERLDIALLNAGVQFNEWSTTKEGFETTLHVNVISTGLLGLLLLPTIEKTAKLPVPAKSNAFKPHLTIVGSDVHYWAGFKEHSAEHPIHVLNEKEKFNGGDRYQVSKLLDLYLAREIGKRAGDGVVVNVVNPGLCYSELARNSSLIVTVFLFFLRLFLARTPEQGSRNFIWAATNDTPSGSYIQDCGIRESSDFSLTKESDQAQSRVWADLAEIWTKTAPETKSLTS